MLTVGGFEPFWSSAKLGRRASFLKIEELLLIIEHVAAQRQGCLLRPVSPVLLDLFLGKRVDVTVNLRVNGSLLWLVDTRPRAV